MASSVSIRAAGWLGWLAVAGLTLGSAPARAVPFLSDGSDGVFAPATSVTIDLATQGNNGVFNFTTIDIPDNVTVRFLRGPTNPSVVFGAVGDINVAGTIVISAGGRIGGPGGGDGGIRGDGAAPATAGDGDAPGQPGGFTPGTRGGGGGGGGNASPGGVATSRSGPAVGAGGGALAPPAIIAGGSGGGGGAGGVFFGVNTSGGNGGGAGGGLQLSSATGVIDLSGSLLSDGGHGGEGFAIQGGPGGGGSGGNFELNAGAISVASTATVRAIGGAGGGLSSESCTITDPYRCSSFANGGLGYAVFDAATTTFGVGADIFARAVGTTTPLSLPGFSPDDPLLPIPPIGPAPWVFGPIDVLPTAVGGFGGPSIWVDPDVAVGYDYAVGDANIASVELPSGFGDDVYEIWLLNPASGDFEFVQNLAAGIKLDLTGLNPFGSGALSSGVDALRVLGIEASELLDPADASAFPTGLTFMPLPGVNFSNLITANLTMTPLTEFVDTGGNTVAAPGTLLLWSMGLGCAALARRRRGGAGRAARA